MAVRYNGISYDLIFWVFLSVTTHLIVALIISFSPKAVDKTTFTPYEVELLPIQELVKPEDTIEKTRPPERQGREKIKSDSRIVKTAKEESKAAEAIARLRERVVAEEAIERIRKKIKESESRREVRISVRPPAKTYRYEELDAELRAYFEKVSRIIREAWYLPEALRDNGYRTILSIHIKKDGAVESLWVEESSGNKLYDESTIRTINKVTPLPPLPQGWKGGFIDLGLRF